MKKFLSIMLALVMVLSMSTVAFAADAEWDGTYTSTPETTFSEIVKTYTSENNVVVNETLSFTSTADTQNPDDGTANLTVADLTVSSLNPGTLSVTIPSLSKAGTYEWTIEENTGNTAGVTYSTDEVHVIVLVEYDNVEHKLKIANTSCHIKGVKNTVEGEKKIVKKETFTNTFESGSFTVAKDVIGNMANVNDEFEISVTLTSTMPVGTNINAAGTTVAPSQWTTNYEADKTTVKNYTYTSTLNYSKLGGAKTFSDIPVGVTVTVAETEDASKMNGYEKEGIYTAYTVENNQVKEGTTEFTSLTVEDSTNATITVVNSKTASVETGIDLDSMPYVLMLAVACVGMFLFISKKRMMREN